MSLLWPMIEFSDTTKFLPDLGNDVISVKLHSLEPFVALIFSNLTWAVLCNRQCFYCESIVCE